MSSITDWTSGAVGSTSPGAAGTTTGAGDGWIDLAGGAATAGSAGHLALVAVAGIGSTLLRPSSENLLNQTRVMTFAQSSTDADRYIALRYSEPDTDYMLGYTTGGTVLYIFRNIAGAFTVTAGPIAVTAPADGHVVRLTASVTGTTSVALSLTVYDVTAAAAVGTITYTDTSPPAALQVAGQSGLFAAVSGGHNIATLLTADHDASTGPVTIATDDSDLLYSPFNWDVTNARAKTINAGAYIRSIFGGTSLSITTDTSGNTSGAYPQIWTRVDNGAWVKNTLTAGNPTVVVATGIANRKHLFELVVKSLAYSVDRWNTQIAALNITGFVLDNGAVLTPVQRKPKTILIYGDSITEGLRTVSAGATPETDDGDALQGWAYALSQMYPAEVGIVGAGGSGLTVTGSGNWPVLASSYDHLWSGKTRSFASPPDLIVYNEGTNDGSSIVSAYTGVVNALLTSCPNAKQLLLRPFGGQRASDVQATVATVNNPKVVYGDTTGFFNTADSADGLHPYGYADVGIIAPQLAVIVDPLLFDSGGVFPTAGDIVTALKADSTYKLILSDAAGRRTFDPDTNVLTLYDEADGVTVLKTQTLTANTQGVVTERT